MNKAKADPQAVPDSPKLLLKEEQKLNLRIAKRFAQHQNDELMIWLKSLSRRHLLQRLRQSIGKKV